MDELFDMSVKIARGPSATICDLIITDAVGITRTFVGEAKKHPSDEYDQQIGDMYSFLRALRAAADYIEANADEKVRRANETRIELLGTRAEGHSFIADHLDHTTIIEDLTGNTITELLDLLKTEVTVTPYPEHDKLAKIRDKSQAIGEFVEWLAGQGIHFGTYDDFDRFQMVRADIEGRLADYFNIDLTVLEDEKRAMLHEQRILNEQAYDAAK